jgi:lipopolysaccharide/colanic/teichoic acid biosynthesis glycosyltransferase
MASGKRYRGVSAAGAGFITLAILALANARPIQAVLAEYTPVRGTVLGGEPFLLAALTTVLVVGLAVAPLYKPRSRRILNIVFRSQRRIGVAGLALAAMGYFGFPYRLPQGVLAASVGTLMVVLPVWFVAIRRRPGDGERTIIVGDDTAEIRAVHRALENEPLGYVGPPSARADGGVVLKRTPTPEQDSDEAEPGPIGEHDRIAGLSRFAEVIESREVDVAAFAFAETDREKFFGALATCHDQGVDAVILRDRADGVLVSGHPGRDLLEIDVEPWDWQERVVKRAFDVAFASVGLLFLSPFILAIAAAIKAEDGGSILYGQDRTAELGETFTAYKFRSMVENAEAKTGATLSEEDAGGRDPRVTQVGYFLRKTHMDEIPQLWSILVGDMSAVGPRPERPELDGEFNSQGITWRKRWFVKPGLTGLAQINEVTGVEPRKKLRYDVEYIGSQSLRTDVAIVIRQIWQVVVDGVAVLRGEDPEEKPAD